MRKSGECEFTRARFLGLEEGSLGPEEAGRVRAHVAGCAGCRGAWERWEAEDRSLREALGAVPAPRDLAGAVVARVRKEAMRRAAPGRRVGLVRWGAVAAAAAVLLALGGWMLLGKRYERIGQVAAVEGEVLARQRGARRATALRAGAVVYAGDELVAGVASRVAVEFYDRSRLALAERTGVQLHCGSGGEEHGCGLGLPHVCLRQGEVECELNSLRYFRAVGTPLGTAIVQGTRFRMKCVGEQRVLLEVLEGEVLFSCPGGQVVAGPGGVWAIEGTGGMPRRLPEGVWE